MNTRGYSNIPSILLIAQGTTCSFSSTFIELLVGTMITRAGFVTEAWLAINPLRSWNAYYS